jgi:hypothetical protein
LRSVIPIIAALVTVVTTNVSLAQSTATPPPKSGATCPPDVKGEPPTVGGGSSEPLSDKLAQSKGVICPPAGVDPQMQIAPPSGGYCIRMEEMRQSVRIMKQCLEKLRCEELAAFGPFFSRRYAWPTRERTKWPLYLINFETRTLPARRCWLASSL